MKSMITKVTLSLVALTSIASADSPQLWNSIQVGQQLAQQGRAASEIPFEKCAGMIWLKVTCAGHAEPLTFLLDSGAGATVFDLAAARRTGLELGARETVRGVDGDCPAFRLRSISATI